MGQPGQTAGDVSFPNGHRIPRFGSSLVWEIDYADVKSQFLQMTQVLTWQRGRSFWEGQLLFARSKCGRLVQSYSMTQGEIWHSILPTELASAAAPPMLVQIPSTADLLCVWNQVSGEEIRRGWHRGRLTAAISKDSGLTWVNFKTLELQEGMDDVARIAPEFPIAREVRGRPGLGQLVDGYAQFTYSNVDFVNDQVFIRYHRLWMKGVEKPATTKPSRKWADYEKQKKQSPWRSQAVLRIYPLEWFYE